MTPLLAQLNKDGVEVARRFLVGRQGGGTISEYDRGELEGLARAVHYIIGVEMNAVLMRWQFEASQHFTVTQAEREKVEALWAHWQLEAALKSSCIHHYVMAPGGMVCRKCGDPIKVYTRI